LAAGLPVSYLKYRRPIQSGNSGGQHYIAVDKTIWGHAGPDLGDLRIFTADKEIPYKLISETGGSQTELKQFRVLQPASLASKTQFLLDMSGVGEYDRINLKLAARNFVAHARVEGQDDPHGNRWAVLGTTTLYDLTHEKLGRNSTLQIPLSTFKYLRVTVDPVVKPTDVENGMAGVTRSQKAIWRDLDIPYHQLQQGKDTVLSFAVSDHIPVEQLALDIDPEQGNFLRQIEIRDDRGPWCGAREISRVHMLRNGEKVDVEDTSIDLCTNRQVNLQAVIHNGDDSPLKITGAHLRQYERRIYFDSAPPAQTWLYYGDEKLASPEYDYAKLFQLELNAGQAALSGEELNSAYTGRPDERPWSERHPAVLWLAILAAVAVLGSVAVRSLKTAGKPVQ
jgi:hypothetical protein